MVTPVIRRAHLIDGMHNVARPVPPPPINRRISEFARAELDDLGRQLEQWLRDLPLRSTEAGD